MKMFFPFVLFASLSFFSSAYAQDLDVSPAGFWPQLQALAARCAVQPYTDQSNGQKTYGAVESTCSDLKIDGSTATFFLEGETYVATLTDSADSDGGDLNDLTVTDASGKVVIAEQNILAYRDIVVALVGNKVQFKDVYVPSL